jgi:hypothetical protein
MRNNTCSVSGSLRNCISSGNFSSREIAVMTAVTTFRLACLSTVPSGHLWWPVR